MKINQFGITLPYRRLLESHSYTNILRAVRAVGSDLVVILPPIFNDFPGLFQVDEPICIQALIQQPTVEAFF